MTAREICDYMINSYVTCMWWDKLTDVSQKMYFIAIHYVYRGEY